MVLHPNFPANRRWYQFSLRTMFVALTVVSTLLAVGLRWIAPAQRQRVAVKAVERLGGYVEYATADEHWPITWLRRWLPQDYFDDVVVVNLAGCTVNDAWLSHLGDLPRVQWLQLDNTPISDSGLVHQSRLPQLQGLSLGSTKITDAGLTHLRGLTKLQWLHLHDISISDAGLPQLRGLVKLDELWLVGTATTDAGEMELQNALPNCAIHR